MVNCTTAPELSNACHSSHSSVGWLRHSRAVDALWRPASTIAELENFGASCGPVAFAALARLRLEAVTQYFPTSDETVWTNRVTMRRALRAIGFEFDKNPGTWPRVGLCLIHFTGPWTRRGYPAAILQHTHWIAVYEEYVFDINWNGWLPRANWEEVVIEHLLARRLLADGWALMTAYEVSAGAPYDFPQPDANRPNATNCAPTWAG